MEKTWKETLIDCGWLKEIIKDWTEEECEDEYSYAIESTGV